MIFLLIGGGQPSKKMARCKYITKKTCRENGVDLSSYPNFSGSGSIAGMKRQYYGKDAKLVRSGAFIYNVTSAPANYGPYKKTIYDLAK